MDKKPSLEDEVETLTKAVLSLQKRTVELEKMIEEVNNHRIAILSLKRKVVFLGERHCWHFNHGDKETELVCCKCAGTKESLIPTIKTY